MGHQNPCGQGLQIVLVMPVAATGLVANLESIGQPFEDPKSSTRDIVACYDVRWQIELMFKELKTTLGFNHFRFELVERWVAARLLTFLFLESYRDRQLRRPHQTAEANAGGGTNTPMTCARLSCNTSKRMSYAAYGYSRAGERADRNRMD